MYTKTASDISEAEYCGTTHRTDGTREPLSRFRVSKRSERTFSCDGAPHPQTGDAQRLVTTCDFTVRSAP